MAGFHKNMIRRRARPSEAFRPRDFYEDGKKLQQWLDKRQGYRADEGLARHRRPGGKAGK